jgi:hypothetical protein
VVSAETLVFVEALRAISQVSCLTFAVIRPFVVGTSGIRAARTRRRVHAFIDVCAVNAVASEAIYTLAFEAAFSVDAIRVCIAIYHRCICAFIDIAAVHVHLFKSLVTVASVISINEGKFDASSVYRTGGDSKAALVNFKTGVVAASSSVVSFLTLASVVSRQVDAGSEI